LIFFPAQAGGSSLGVVFSAIFPQTVLLLMSIVMLLVALYSTVCKIQVYWEKEKLLRGDLRKNAEDDDFTTRLLDKDCDASNNVIVDQTMPYNQNVTHNDNLTGGCDQSLPYDNTANAKHEKNMVDASGLISKVLEAVSLTPPRNSIRSDTYCDRDSKAKHHIIESNAIRLSGNLNSDFPSQFYSTEFTALLIFWIVFAALFVAMEVFVDGCSLEYFLILFSIYIPIMVISYWGLNHVGCKQREDNRYNLEGDIAFASISIIPSILAFIIGLICALLGLGGSELMSPLFLSMNVLPQVTSGTVPLLSFYYSSSTIFHYAALGEVNYMFGVITFMIGFSAGFTGRSLSLYIVKKYGFVSITMVGLALMLVLSIILIIYEIADSKTEFIFHNFC
jgi:uncharacterized membrane protein YfcA